MNTQPHPSTLPGAAVNALHLNPIYTGCCLNDAIAVKFVVNERYCMPCEGAGPGGGQAAKAFLACTCHLLAPCISIKEFPYCDGYSITDKSYATNLRPSTGALCPPLIEDPLPTPWPTPQATTTQGTSQTRLKQACGQGAMQAQLQPSKPSRWARLLESPELSDLELHLLQCHTGFFDHEQVGTSPVRAQPACSSCSGTASYQGSVTIKEEEASSEMSGFSMAPAGTSASLIAVIPAHAVALASASGYWKARILHWRDHPWQTSHKRVKTGPGRGSIVLEEHISPADLPAVEAAIKYAYTDAVPVAAADLMQAACLASRWEMAEFLEACLAALSSIPADQIKQEDLNTIFDANLPHVLANHAMFGTILSSTCKDALIRLFGKPQAVICDNKKLQAFCCLPFQAVCHWASYTELQVDSENSVAVLLSGWWAHNEHALNAERRNEYSQRLSSLLRVQHLTDSFLTVLHSLPWFVDPTPGFTKALLLMRQLSSAVPKSIPGVPAAWVHATPRLKCDKTAETVSEPWAIHRSQLAWLHEQATHQQAELTSPGIYWKGYIWHMKLGLASSSAPLYLGLSITSPAPQAFPVPLLVPATFKLAVENRTTGMAYVETCDFSDGMWQCFTAHGSGNLLDVQQSEHPREESVPPWNMMSGDLLHLRLVMVNAN